VFLGGDTLPLDTDSHYHLRRALLTLANFPRVPLRDPWMNWPEGAVPTWGPGFDQLLALPPWLLGAAGDASRAARIIAWVPPALGVIAVLLAMRIARAMEPEPEARTGVGVSAGLLAAALPIAALTSMVGRTDHHAFEDLTTLVVAAWLLRPRGLATGARFELVGAALVFATVHVFSGAVIQWGLATLALVAARLSTGAPARAGLAGSGGPALLLGAAALGLLDGGWMRAQGPAFHHLQLSFLQPALLVAGGLTVCAASLVADRFDAPGLPRRLATRGAVTLAALLPLAALTALAAPTLAHEVSTGLVDWLATRDPWMNSIRETAPLLRGGTLAAWNAYAGLALAAPLLAPLGMRRAARRGVDAAVTAAVLGGGLVALTLLQQRFGRASSALLASLCALGLAELVAVARRRWSPARAAGASVVAALAWVTLDPGVHEQLRAPQGAWITDVHTAALFLRRGAPTHPTRGQRAAVFAHWDMGFEVLDVARRPTVVTGFGPYGSRETWRETEPAWRGDEARMLRVLDAHDAGFVMFLASVFLAQSSPRGTAAMRRSSRGGLIVSADFLRETPVAAMLIGGSGVADRGVAHLGHLRPVFASPNFVRPMITAVPAVAVFERVAGARLVGAAPDGARVRASIPLRLRHAQRAWEATTAAVGGRWSITVPLPTAWQSGGGVATGPRYEVRIGEAVARVTVSDEAVRVGAAVPVEVPR